MCTFEQDFKQAIDELCEERKYHVDYVTIGSDPKVIIIARIRGGTSWGATEVILTARGCKVIVPQTNIEETFKKNELDCLVDCIRRLLENPVANQ